MKFNRFACFALSALMGLSVCGLAACGETKNDDENKKDPDTPIVNPDDGEDKVVYPNDPYFLSLSEDKDTKASFKAHDPVMVEAMDADGYPMYYAFSTDNDGGYGVQVRSSFDMSTWEFEGPAIEGFTANMSETAVQNLYRQSSFHLHDVYTWISSDSKFDCWTLWAPDVVPAAGNTDLSEDGGWWMYSCWTTGFGSSRSIIFKLNAENVKGPYTFDTVIVRDNPGGDGNLNEIDPSIYYSADKSRMFMSYGSFFGGFGVIELDPSTGRRLNNEEDTVAGKKMVTASGFDAEGSSVAYYERDVYTGDIASEEYNESKWEKQGKYIMMASDGALSYNYVMRTWESDTPDGPFNSGRGGYGFQVAGNWTWRHQGEDETVGDAKQLNFYIPGHNDMLTTTDGRNLIVYHTRIAEGMVQEKDGSFPGYNTGEHYLYTGLIDFNSKGQLVVNPNRYAGREKVGAVTKEELLGKTEGKFSVIQMESSDVDYRTKRPVAYAQDCVLHEDGTITGAVTGTWKMYGSHYIFIKLGEDEYYGSVMPAWIRQYDATSSTGIKGNAGLTISAVTDVKDNENKILYLNMQF